MNRNLFKVIFSKRTGKLTVVSEITPSTGKTASESTGNGSWGYQFAVNPLSFVLMLTMGTAAVIPANAQVIADGNAPGNQRPIITNTASGATQVNIMTPSAAGVSMNQYSRFDVNNPMILNNSRTSVNTQTAGMVQGNPFLATGSARIIVNQVNGNLARINNSIEIAGPRSELIIAAPAGIMVNGSTIINASRTTLTTGTPLINGGNLEGYRVTQGQISVDGRGLDTNQSDYTDILARSVQANAGIWAKNLNVVTGTNQIDRNNNATQIAGEGAAPSIAIDTGALGGMYAGKIFLTATEKGIGVNNAGQIAASAGQVTISADGLLTNSGTISSNGQDNTTTVNTTAVRNSGTISAQGNSQIQTSAELQNSGTIAAGRALKVNANTIDNSNGVLNGQRLDLTTNSLNNTQGKIQQTGFTQALALNAGSLNNINNGIIGYAPIDSTGGSSSGGSSSGSTSGTSSTDTPSTAAGGGTTTVVQPAPLPTLTDGVINVAGHINNDAGQITANGGIDLTSSNGLTNHATLSLNKLKVSGNALDNTNGTITTTQADINTANITNTSGKFGSTGNIDLAAQNLTNSKGQITAGGTITANIAQTVLNDNGTIGSTDALSLSSNALNNSSGIIASTKAQANVNSTGSINNTKGTIQAATALNISGNGLNNTDGTINGSTTTVNSQTGALNNTRGSIAGDNLTITSGALTNDAGLIQGTKALAINTNGQTLTNINSGNANGIVSGGTLKVQSGNLNNNTGSISSNADTTINAANITSQSGSITSLGNATITGTGFDNQGGQVQSIGNTQINVGSGTVNNNNGLIRTDGDTAINAATVINSNTNGTDKGIEGKNVSLNANNVDNTSGAIRADETLSIIGTGTVNNTSGLITSSKAVVIKDSNAATNPSAKTQTVINSNGTISAGTSNTIDSKSLTGDGKLTSNQDLSISINTDYANTGELTADGKLTLNTTGNINNTSKISAGSDLNVSATNIDNAANAEINGNTTSIHANDTLTNRGLIDGGDTVVTAGNTINNIGTGRIYGNNLSVGTTTLNNIDETINGVNKAATIAAREDLDIGAQTINNIEHSSLISLGDMRIGGALGSVSGQSNIAVGKAAVINNNSATIESTGDMSINVGQLNNRNMHFATGQVVVGTEQRYYYRPSVSSPYYNQYESEIRNTNTNAIVTNPNQAGGNDVLYTPWGEDEEWYYRDVIATTTRSTVTQSDPGKIISGGAMNINLDNGLNDKSQIIAGGALTITGGSLNNQQATGTEQTIERGKVIHTYVSGNDRKFDTFDPSYDNAYNPTTITLDNIAVQQQNVNAGSGNTVAAHGSTAAGGASGAGQANAITEIYATGTTDPTMIRTGGVNTAIPNSSLFSVNPNGNGYLIATDPRFIDASRWLSSDFMLKALNLDPANVHKRLGDAYYEQKLIREQIAQLTGRRYLDGQTSDDDQYKALMNAGVTFANQYNLRLGIALTPEQIARLTSDIVWLVEQTVTLPDGTKTTALVPQVYVRTRPGDITGNGALISGSSVKLNLTGDLNNQGNIAGRKLVQIDANNINNLNGRIGAGADATILNAKTDLNNIGGTIEANNYLAAKAGRDVNVITTTSTATTDGKRTQTSNTGVDRIAGLYVNNPDGLLIVDAGNNVNLKGADIITAEGGITSISAKNDINAGTVGVSSTINTTKDSKNYDKTATTAEVGTVISSGSVYMNAGNNVNARQVSIYADEGPIAIKAGNNVTLDAGQTTFEGSGAFADKAGKRKTSAVGTGRATTDIGSTLSGQGVSIQAGNADTPAGQGNVNMTAAQIDAGDGALIIKAKNDVNIEEGRDTLETATHWETSKKGFLKKKSTVSERAHSSDTSISSNLTGNQVLIGAGNDVNITGSNVVSETQTWIDAKNNININAATNTESVTTYQAVKKSGLMGTGGIGVTIGSAKNTLGTTSSATTHTGSVIAANGGDVKPDLWQYPQHRRLRRHRRA